MLQHFRVYLEGAVEKLLVYTDNNLLVFINQMKDKNQQLLRWSLALQEYNLKIGAKIMLSLIHCQEQCKLTL